MSVRKGKYRGTTTYFQVLAELVRAAQYQGLTTYQDMAVIMGIPVTGNYMSREMGLVLGEISEDEVAAGRSMLSSVAVTKAGKVGAGFFAFAEQIGKLPNGADKQEFLASERRATYNAWKRPIPSA